MKTIVLIEKLRKLPLFTINDLSKITGLSPFSVRILASRLTKRNLITHIERSKYTAIDDSLITASYITRPSYLALYSALRFHNMTTQIVNDIDLIVPKSRKNTRINNRKIHFSKTKHFWGFEKYKLRGYEILVSNPEKTIIDSLLSGKVRSHIIFEALKSIEIDESLLFSYAKRIGNNSLGKRLGYLLEKAGFDTTNYLIFSISPYILLDPKKRKKGIKNKQWKIIENEVVK